ncbi:Hypothetical protein IALB_2928 [Ignavibacterium album JCM 16511]|uniref:Uncharacterized protein n=1 Tax=Ignavibacterium album (strain DSM 19864 / JCM 16511 / NBRC 101810 / Mat9-16) TaxID=945713 RepID=I0ANS4_IGNAJ|nr:hypothetical protein [Ignavibacterium album]AFH50631.1 Hypothetical protein IALB_2928 [Ignavibacterium album JCM 16511]
MLKLKLTYVRFLDTLLISKHLKIFLLFTLPILMNLSCNTIEPTDELKPGRRDYVWTVDTLDTQMNRIQSIWGSSPDNVWAVGPGGLNANEKLWHFNGNVWQPYQQVLPTAPECIYGTDQNNIWIGGSDGKIFRFDGTSWNQVHSIIRSDTSGNWINDIVGKESNDIYAIGYAYLIQEPKQRSFILHYDGVKWKEIYFSKSKLQFLRVQKKENTLFLSGTILTLAVEPDTMIIYKFENKILSEIYRNTIDKITYLSLNQIGNDPYYLIGKELNKYVNNKFVKVTSFNNQAFGYQIYGRSEKDIFVRMTDGLAHYNGADLEYLFHFSNQYTSILNRALIFEKDVFFTVHDNINDLSLILRGHLKD